MGEKDSAEVMEKFQVCHTNFTDSLIGLKLQINPIYADPKADPKNISGWGWWDNETVAANNQIKTFCLN